MPTVSELLEALPAEKTKAVETPSAQSSGFQAIFDSLAHRRVPTGGLQRFCSISGLSAKLGMAYLAWWIRSWYKPAEASEKDLLETNLRSALNTLETMGYLRGAITKVGQLLTNFPESVPAEFVDVLGSLHFQAPPMHFSLIREQLLNELGDTEDLFSQIDETAMAAASIGQVHRARLKTGEDVAIKIQYPGIGRTIQADLRNLKMLMRPMLFNSDWRALEETFEEVRTGLESETDYENEAKNLSDVAQLFQDDDEIVVPHVIEHASSRRVLTMEFVPGRTMDQFLAADPTQLQRDDYGERISRALYRVFLNRMLYTDAHPGNFIFMDDNRLGFIDFGNVRRFTAAEWNYHCDVSRARDGTDEDAEAICIRSLRMTDEDAQKHRETLELVIEGFHYYNEPVMFEGEFDYGDPRYIRRGAEWLARVSKQRWLRQEPVNVFAHRLNFQVPALLYLMKSRVNVHRLVQELGNELPS
ncbi:MAG: AarF/ABC1/UbiB kinase family protein [Pirellulaceae bacterium]|jgi:predicted unusual protein kinase regulating ubiquinone biosynthesis (AarF/ABC1/UbiB family)|nr:AarF/ABC1/UbiB kinase family protein [Pirellulaceae bacterium]MDP6556016.1 AarF/ABC1/UbiB kinase family protein [Pirellulaceae bacterium]